jgi:hypothetical protein
MTGFFRLQFPDLFWHFSNAGKARTFFDLHEKLQGLPGQVFETGTQDDRVRFFYSTLNFHV